MSLCQSPCTGVQVANCFEKWKHAGWFMVGFRIWSCQTQGKPRLSWLKYWTLCQLYRTGVVLLLCLKVFSKNTTIPQQHYMGRQQPGNCLSAIGQQHSVLDRKNLASFSTAWWNKTAFPWQNCDGFHCSLKLYHCMDTAWGSQSSICTHSYYATVRV